MGRKVLGVIIGAYYVILIASAVYSLKWNRALMKSLITDEEKKEELNG